MPTDRNLNSFTTLTPPGTKPVVNSIMRDFSAEALAELRLWLEQNPPAIGISNILGFSQFTVQAATTIVASESTTSATYVDLTTPGPVLTGLPDGQYLIAFGGFATVGAGGSAWMSPSVNSATPVDNDAAIFALSSSAGSTRIVTEALSAGGNNTVKIKYRTDSGATGTFQRRWMIALRYANK